MPTLEKPGKARRASHHTLTWPTFLESARFWPKTYLTSTQMKEQWVKNELTVAARLKYEIGSHGEDRHQSLEMKIFGNIDLGSLGLQAQTLETNQGQTQTYILNTCHCCHGKKKKTLLSDYPASSSSQSNAPGWHMNVYVRPVSSQLAIWSVNNVNQNQRMNSFLQIFVSKRL